ncbi:cytochrome P450, partial [Chytridium lagenaria]
MSVVPSSNITITTTLIAVAAGAAGILILRSLSKPTATKDAQEFPDLDASESSTQSILGWILWKEKNVWGHHTIQAFLAFDSCSLLEYVKWALTKGEGRYRHFLLLPSLRANCSKILSHLADESQQGKVDVQPLNSAKIFTYNAIASFLACADANDEATLLTLREDFLTWSQGLGDLFIPNGSASCLPLSRLSGKGEDGKALGVMMDKGESFQDGLGYLVAARDEEGSELTMEEIRDNFINLCFAGYDTTAASICSIFHVLTHEISPEELTLLRDEVLSVSDTVEESTLTSLPKYSVSTPPVVGVFKKMAVDHALDDGRIVKAGTMLSINFMANHLEESVYPDPLKFKLSRFLVDEIDKKFPGDFTPFSSGIRLYEIVHFELLRNYELTAGSKPTVFHTLPIWMAVPNIRLRNKSIDAYA